MYVKCSLNRNTLHAFQFNFHERVFFVLVKFEFESFDLWFLKFIRWKKLFSVVDERMFLDSYSNPPKSCWFQYLDCFPSRSCHSVRRFEFEFVDLKVPLPFSVRYWISAQPLFREFIKISKLRIVQGFSRLNVTSLKSETIFVTNDFLASAELPMRVFEFLI